MKKTRKNQKIPKMSFQLSGKIFLFWGGGSKMSFFDNLAKKARTPKTLKIGVSAKHLKQKNICVTKRPFLDQKNPNPEFQLSFFLPFFLLFQQQKHKKMLKPLFYSVLAT